MQKNFFIKKLAQEENLSTHSFVIVSNEIDKSYRSIKNLKNELEKISKLLDFSFQKKDNQAILTSLNDFNQCLMKISNSCDELINLGKRFKIASRKYRIIKRAGFFDFISGIKDKFKKKKELPESIEPSPQKLTIPEIPNRYKVVIDEARSTLLKISKIFEELSTFRAENKLSKFINKLYDLKVEQNKFSSILNQAKAEDFRSGRKDTMPSGLVSYDEEIPALIQDPLQSTFTTQGPMKPGEFGYAYSPKKDKPVSNYQFDDEDDKLPEDFLNFEDLIKDFENLPKDDLKRNVSTNDPLQSGEFRYPHSTLEYEPITNKFQFADCPCGSEISFAACHGQDKDWIKKILMSESPSAIQQGFGLTEEEANEEIKKSNEGNPSHLFQKAERIYFNRLNDKWRKKKINESIQNENSQSLSREFEKYLRQSIKK